MKVAIVCSGLDEDNDIMRDKLLRQLIFFTMVGNRKDDEFEIYDINRQREKTGIDYEKNLIALKKDYPFIKSWNKVDVYLIEFLRSNPNIKFDLIFFIGCVKIELMFKDRIDRYGIKNIKMFEQSFKEYTKLFLITCDKIWSGNWTEVIKVSIKDEFKAVYEKFMSDFIFDPYSRCYTLSNSKNLLSIEQKTKIYKNLINKTEERFSDEKEYSSKDLELYINNTLKQSLKYMYDNRMLNVYIDRIKIKKGMDVPKIFSKIFNNITRHKSVFELYKLLKNNFG
jgi:hypothetical protein